MFADLAVEHQESLSLDDSWWPQAPRRATAGFRHSVGARAADPATWLAPRPLDVPLLAWKRRLLEAVGPAAFAALPATEGPGAHVLEAVEAAVGPRAARPDGCHPLLAAARIVVEDLCLLRVDGPSPVLVAAVVAMPNRWLLADKIGRDLLGVHEPVPGYAADIGTASDRLLSHLRPGRVTARTTWNILDDPRLFQPSAVAAPDGGKVDVARLWLRTEYQTLRALPERYVLFTIRTGRVPLSEALRRPERAAALAAAIDALPPEQRDHKGITPAVLRQMR